MESANTIFITICFKTEKFNMPVNIMYIFFIIKMKENSKNYFREYESGFTAKAEFAKIVSGIFRRHICNHRLTIKPIVPESSRFLLRDIVLLYLM